MGEVDRAPWADRPPGLWHQGCTRVHGWCWRKVGAPRLQPPRSGGVGGQACGSRVPSGGGGAADGGSGPWGPQSGPRRGHGLVVCSPGPGRL